MFASPVLFPKVQQKVQSLACHGRRDPIRGESIEYQTTQSVGIQDVIRSVYRSSGTGMHANQHSYYFISHVVGLITCVGNSNVAGNRMNASDENGH